jgi:hypothetical protein
MRFARSLQPGNGRLRCSPAMAACVAVAAAQPTATQAKRLRGFLLNRR